MGMIRGPRLVLLGRQGAGKGTQGQRLASHLRIEHLSTGAILRSAVNDGSELGRRVQTHLEEGSLVPDELMLEVVRDQLDRRGIDRRGFLLDGFPRTRAQAEGLLALLGEGGLDCAIDLDVPLAVARRRLAARRVCTRCETPTSARRRERTVYCTVCGGTAVRRPDDTPEAIERRLLLHEELVGPLLAFFAEQQLLVRVDSVGSPDDVFDRLMRALRTTLWGSGEAVG